GNFEPHEACTFLRHAGTILGRGAVMVVGVDLIKDEAVLNAAYNDRAGVTARFNLNVLRRINRELGGNFKLAGFEHHAFYNRERKRVEMHLASRLRQKVTIAGSTFEFRAGETIHTENSYKYTPESFAALARGAGWSLLDNWTDAKGNFAVCALVLPALSDR
ncbi:MAG: L-histidine N(alpha)-methyltransferase, partial [Pseudorhodoplanes sp.]